MDVCLAGAADAPELTSLWRRSVEATHAFLAPADVDALEPLVREQVIPALETWVLRSPSGQALGFVALSGSTVEALFVDPPSFGRGCGRLLLAHASTLKGPLSVDVNEQNPGAVQFYRAMGFELLGRSATDGQGRAYPLLHFRQISVGQRQP